jgi:hypothetical protein
MTSARIWGHVGSALQVHINKMLGIEEKNDDKLSKEKKKVMIIGAGFGRTGTTSLKRAFEILGYGPCHHFEEVISASQALKWKEYVKDPTNLDLLHELTGGAGYRATCEFPAARYWDKMLELYPEAKVVLTVRDPEKWYASMCQTIFQILKSYPERTWGVNIVTRQDIFPSPGLNSFNDEMITSAFKGSWKKADIIKAFKEHNENVIKNCPRHQLLVFEVSQGWGPLCDFLEVPVPENETFPFLNDAKEWDTLVIHGKIIVVTVVALLLIMVLLAWHFIAGHIEMETNFIL